MSPGRIRDGRDTRGHCPRLVRGVTMDMNGSSTTVTAAGMAVSARASTPSRLSRRSAQATRRDQPARRVQSMATAAVRQVRRRRSSWSPKAQGIRLSHRQSRLIDVHGRYPIVSHSHEPFRTASRAMGIPATAPSAKLQAAKPRSQPTASHRPGMVGLTYTVAGQVAPDAASAHYFLAVLALGCSAALACRAGSSGRTSASQLGDIAAVQEREAMLHGIRGVLG